MTLKTLRLTADIIYDVDGTSIEWLEDRLRDLISYAEANGMLTGYSDAEVEKIIVKVEVIDTST